MRTLLAAIFRLAYRVEIRGMENYRKAGERLVVVANHLSVLDGTLLADNTHPKNTPSHQERLGVFCETNEVLPYSQAESTTQISERGKRQMRHR